MLSSDGRFKRIDRDRWALSEWEFDTYEGIRPAIRELVAQRGGQIGLDELIENITGRFSVSESSVLTYAASPPFECRNRIVSMLTESPATRKSPAATKRLFRRDKGWTYRIIVSTDHLRGSGSPAPIAVATLFDLKPGETRQIPTAGAHSPQSIAWTGAQPQFGTIRRILLARDFAAGDVAFLVFGDDGIFDIEAGRQLTGDALGDALALVGQAETDSPTDALSRIATAVGLSPDATIAEVVTAARNRGDDDIADLFAQTPDTTEADEAMAGTDDGV